MTSLLHNCIDERHSKTSKDCGKGPHANIWHMVLRIAVPNCLESEFSIKSNEPAGKSKKQFSKGGMHIEVVLSLDVVGCEFTKVNLIKTENMC